MIMRAKSLLCAAVVVLALAQTAPVAEPARQTAGGLAMKKALTLQVAKEIAAASSRFAQKNQWNVVISIVDNGGHLVYLERMDGVQTGSVQVAIRKAEAAAAFKRPTRLFEQAVAEGRTALLALPGGVPIPVGDEIIGAVGVSGVTAQQDGLIAQAGVDALPRIIGQ